MTLFQSPGFLLAIVGLFLGLNFPLGKLAAAAAIPSLVWATLVAASAALVLGGVVLLQKRKVRLDAHHLRYFVITAVVSNALPNGLVFAAIPHLGSGLASILYTLSPILTLLISVLAGLKRPQRLEVLALVVGMVGALLVVSGRGEVGRPAELAWLMAGLTVPLLLASGNVYRTIDWPQNTDPLWLAVGTNLAAALLLLAITLVTSGGGSLFVLAKAPGAALAQAVVSSLFYSLYFPLQRIGGPVTLSQIGTVAAAVSVCVGTLLLGERYPQVVWLGVAVIALSIALTVMARMRKD